MMPLILLHFVTTIAAATTAQTAQEGQLNEATIVDINTNVSVSQPNLSIAQTDTQIPLELQKEIDVLAYIENFKSAMVDYVTSQYKNLTPSDTDQVKLVLEEFLKNFAKDLRLAVERQYRLYEITENPVVYEPIDDGIPDATFQDINERVKTEFPDVNDNTAMDIVYRLRKNLFETRQKLDAIIVASQQAQSQS